MNKRLLLRILDVAALLCAIAACIVLVMSLSG